MAEQCEERLSNLAVAVGKLERSVEIFTEEFRGERRDNASSRTALGVTIAANSVSMQDLASRVAAIDARILKLEPIVSELRDIKTEAMGMAKLGRFMWAGIGAASAGVVSLITYIAQMKFGK